MSLLNHMEEALEGMDFSNPDDVRGGPNYELNVPSDPTLEDPDGSELRRSDTCSVCLSKSENYHLNYGAPTCLSCRAFFRRAVTGQKIQPCLMNRTCEISVQNRGDCRYCRYQKCMAVGMKPDQVMSETSKRARFKKMFKKKDDVVEIVQEKPKAKRGRPRKKPDILPRSSMTDIAPVGSHDCRPIHRHPTTDEKVLRSQMVELLRHWRGTVTKQQLSPEVTTVLQALAQNGTSVPGTVLKEQLDMIGQLVRIFARSVHDFNLLTSYDQDLLLKRNLHMFPALALAKSLGTATVQHKIEFLLCGDDRWLKGLKSDQDLLSSHSTMFGPGFIHALQTSLPHIRSQVESINNYELSSHWFCVIVYGILFYTDPASSHLFNDQEQIHAFSQHSLHFVKLLGWTNESFLTFLGSLKDLGDELPNIEWAEKVQRPLSIHYTQMEETNITGVAKVIMDRIQKVNVGSDMLTELIMVNLDVPLSRNFAARGKMLWSKKTKMALDHFDEYRNLSLKHKAFIHQESLGPIMGLIAYWHDNILTPIKQFKLALGRQDLDQFEVMARNEARNWQPRHVAVKEIYPMDCKELVPSMDLVQEGFNRLGDFAKNIVDEHFFYLFFLFVLFQPCSKVKELESDPVSNLSRKFQFMLIRRSKMDADEIQKGIAGINMIAKGISDALYILEQS
eukprot:snap_masked-scaffold233_size243130-processed-gene-1.8 protein:Tk00488 transcript:snap_masked-scaffold233_size243130-processed-gene-1.8-mRNA-1 annotation:"nuclear hormone receptor ftz-f1-like"